MAPTTSVLSTGPTLNRKMFGIYVALFHYGSSRTLNAESVLLRCVEKAKLVGEASCHGQSHSTQNIRTNLGPGHCDRRMSVLSGHQH